MHDPNIDILEANRPVIEARAREDLQAGITLANSLIDPSYGIVAGDGCYYPRFLPDGRDPFEH